MYQCYLLDYEFDALSYEHAMLASKFKDRFLHDLVLSLNLSLVTKLDHANNYTGILQQWISLLITRNKARRVLMPSYDREE